MSQLYRVSFPEQQPWSLVRFAGSCAQDSGMATLYDVSDLQFDLLRGSWARTFAARQETVRHHG